MACKEDPLSCKTNGQLNTDLYNNWTDSYCLLTRWPDAAGPLAAPAALRLRAGIPRRCRSTPLHDHFTPRLSSPSLRQDSLQTSFTTPRLSSPSLRQDSLQTSFTTTLQTSSPTPQPTTAFDFANEANGAFSSFYTGRFSRENVVPKIGDPNPIYQ